MPRTTRDVPPPLELLCLRALWTLREGNVKQVQTLVSQSRPLAYTTIMTVLERLVRKGRLRRHKAGRAFVYSPEASRDVMRRANQGAYRAWSSISESPLQAGACLQKGGHAPGRVTAT